MQKYDQSVDPTQPGLLDFPIREVHCDAPVETEWEKLAQNLQLKVGLQLNPLPPPPQSRKLDWIHEEKILIFFTQKINWKKKCHWESPSVGTEANPSSFFLRVSTKCLT